MMTKKIKIAAIILAIFLFLLIIAFSLYLYVYSGRILTNIKIGSINMGGMSKVAAKQKLSSQAENIKDKDLIVSYQEKSLQISMPDLQINYDFDKTIDTAYSIGRRGNYLQQFKERIIILFNSKKLLTIFSYNKTKVDEQIEKIASEVEVQGKDASFKIENGEINISTELIGKEINMEKFETNFNQEIGFLQDRKLVLEIDTIYPRINESQLSLLKPSLEQIINKPIKLKSDQQEFTIDSNQIGNWIDLMAVSENVNQLSFIKKVFAQEKKLFTPKIFINPEKIKLSVEDLSTKINKDAVDAKLNMNSGRVSVFVSSSDGYKLDLDKTLKLIQDELYNRLKTTDNNSNASALFQSLEIILPVDVTKPTISNDTINNLGIKELISSGTTNFKGSPSNRITNITVGTSMFNGVLIKPSEEFSTIKTLGEISTAHGFLPELVIKEDSTKPEIGGGLCQVSTTLFRAALNAGLEITERTNHKYRVSYYEPPVGMDATIYDPAPDFKFINNTSGYILIQTYIKGSNLTFEFYGTKDGRKIEISDPVTYDVTSPQAPLYKEDASVAPGETKIKEKAHNGSKASFHYKVTSADGKILQEKTFVSSYVPWRAVYLVAPGELPGQVEGAQTDTSDSNNQTPSPSPEPTQTTSSPTPSPTPTETTPTPTPTVTTPTP